MLAGPVLALACLESALRLAHYGRDFRFLVPDDKPGYCRTNPDFASWFLPSHFDLRPLNFRVARVKPANTLRIVVLGESAAQGVPAPEFGFASQLRAQLRSRYPGKAIEVLNTGIVAVNSHVVYQIAREMAGLSPDLFVVYAGNNEVVGPYGPGCAYLSEMPPLWVIRLSVIVKATRTGQLLASIAAGLSRGGAHDLEWRGMSMFANNAVRGDDPRLEAVYRNFEANLRDIVAAARSGGAKVILCTPACNVRDCAPFLSLHRPDLAPADREAWTRAFERGRLSWLMGENEKGRSLLAQALRIDPQYADASYMLGPLELAAGEVAQARRHLADALHGDGLRFRPDPRINAAVRSVAAGADSGVRLLDAALLLGSDPASTEPPAGSSLFLEHVHLDWQGNFRLGRAAAEAAEALAFGSGSGSWLDAGGCAAAVGFTSYERYGELLHLQSIIQNPPFTNQVTYCQQQGAFASALVSARELAKSPEALAEARRVLDAAVVADPESPDLARLRAGVLDAIGDLAGALGELRRGQTLVPRDYGLAAQEAIVLSRMGRFDEAQSLLDGLWAGCPEKDRATLAPGFADLFSRSRRFDAGRRFLSSEIARAPGERRLRVLLARLDHYAGDDAAARADFRAALAADPSDEEALEGLVALLDPMDSRGEVAALTFAAARTQPRNPSNNLRAAILLDRKGDDAGASGYLLAAERSGPVSAAVEIRLARSLIRQHRPSEALLHLAEARGLAATENNARAKASAEQAIAQLRAQEP